MTRSKTTQSAIQVTYPPGAKELTPDLSKDEMVRRLKMLARVFQDMEQEEDTTAYEPLALHLLEPFLFKHPSKDVRLLVACCLADVFRIFAPEAPYRTAEQLKLIFQFLNKQIWGLENVDGPSWKRYFYLLENLAMVKSFNICMELEDSAEVFVELFTILFSIINENHTPKVRTFMLDVMCPLISENDVVPPELLEVILSNLLDSKQLQHPQAHELARDLVKRTSTSIEPSIQAFFNNVLILGRSSTSDLASHTYELIYQLHTISSNLLLAVLPQLEFKLKSNEERERLAVTKLLGRMFSDRDSDLATQNKPLWSCFLGRFSDISIPIRMECVKFVPQFFSHHPYLITEDLEDRLRERAHDTDEGVRQEVVTAIVTAAKRDITNVKDSMLILVKERTLDKKWRIRKEAVLGLGHIFKKWYHSQDLGTAEKQRLVWIRDKILHMYYQPNIEDRLLVERIFTMTLVPYTMDVKDRMQRLYHLFAAVDENSSKAIIEMMKCQHYVRQHVRDLMQIFEMEDEEERKKAFVPKVAAITKLLPEPGKAQEHLRRMIDDFMADKRIRGHMQQVISPTASCRRAIQGVGEVMKKFGNPKNPSPMYETMKTLMERIAPLLIDSAAIEEVVKLVAAQANGTADEVEGLTERRLEERGLKLLQILALVYPRGFSTKESYEKLSHLLQIGEDNVADVALQVLTQTGLGLQADFPEIAEGLIKTLVNLAKNGTPVQAKRAIRCLEVAATIKKTIFQDLFQSVCKNISLEHESHLTALTTLGQLARLAPSQFAQPMKVIVANTVVKGILMQDQTETTPTKGIWCHDNMVTEETQAKIRCIKLLVHWLEGLKSNQNGSATSTIRLLTTMIKNEGDLMERKKISKASMSRLRLAAGCALLKLAQVSTYVELITLEQFQTLALLINDECYQVREQFAIKLNRGLISLRLPLMYMSIFSLCAKDPVQDSKTRASQYIIRNIATRREYLKSHTLTSTQMLSVLPEYVIPFTIHLLTHDPDFMTLKDSEALSDIKECIWFMLEPLIDKAENCSFMRKLLETIKQMKDAQCIEDRSRNRKMYALCDMTLSLLQSKAPFLIVKEHPGDILLPKKLFYKPRKNIHNTDNYLPKRFQEQLSQEDKKNGEKAAESPQKPKGKKGVIKREPGVTAGGDANSTANNGDENSSPIGKGKRKRMAAKTDAPPQEQSPNKRAKKASKTADGKKDHPLTEKVNEGNKPTTGRGSRSQSNQIKARSKVTRGRSSQSSSQQSSSSSDNASQSSSPAKSPLKRTVGRRGESGTSSSSSNQDSQSPAPKKARKIAAVSPKKNGASSSAGRGRGASSAQNSKQTSGVATPENKAAGKRSSSVSVEGEQKRPRGRPRLTSPAAVKATPSPKSGGLKAKSGTPAARGKQPQKSTPKMMSPSRSPQKKGTPGRPRLNAASKKPAKTGASTASAKKSPAKSAKLAKSPKKTAAQSPTKSKPRLSGPARPRGRPPLASPARSTSSSTSSSKSRSPAKKTTATKQNAKKIFAVKGSPIRKFATKGSSKAISPAKSKGKTQSPTKSSVKRNLSASSASPRKLVNGKMSPQKSPARKLIQTKLKTNVKTNVRQTAAKKLVKTAQKSPVKSKLNISRKSGRRR
ncbi:LOW QUALITY PROTEIN: sister chromatid cohesion protein PDS5 homolog A-like [Diadema antillarum]|uniref:LOW QUALITY PROTEIN: sister chromatid cohesion protein PDS5 homolog A-like n=1 Tax=Diadema antillarum TaxID=105358 RepID=UPI003A8AC183